MGIVHIDTHLKFSVNMSNIHIDTQFKIQEKIRYV